MGTKAGLYIMRKRRSVPMLGLETPIEHLTANAAKSNDDHIHINPYQRGALISHKRT
jgi:hypothetical protein